MIEDLQPHCTNWAGNLRYTAAQLDAPRTVDELREIVRASSKLRALGSRHCFNDIADSDTRQVSLRHLRSIEIDAAARTATVGSGVRYGELAPVLEAHGFAVANLASLPHITVAGAVATSTHGSGVRNGSLATSVSALELVDASGDLVQLSRTRERNQFPGAVVSLGGLGVMTRLTLDLIPHFQMTQVVYRNLSMDKLEDNLDAILSSGYSVSLFTHWQEDGITQVWVKAAVAAGEESAATLNDFFGAVPAPGPMHPIEGCSPDNCTQQLGEAGPWYERLPHFRMDFTPSNGAELQSEYFVPRSSGWEAIRAVGTLADSIAPLLLVTELRAVAADDLWMSMAYGRESLAIHFTWKPMPREVMALLPRIEQVLSPFGARPHWGKLFTTAPAKLAESYPRRAEFVELLQRYDPPGKFRNEFVQRNILGA